MLLLVLYSMTFIGSIEPISPAQSYTAADRESADNGGRSATHNIHRDEMGTMTGRDADTNTNVLKSKRNVEFEIYDTNEERHSLQAQQQRQQWQQGADGNGDFRSVSNELAIIRSIICSKCYPSLSPSVTPTYIPTCANLGSITYSHIDTNVRSIE